MWISILDYNTTTIAVSEIDDDANIEEYIESEGFHESEVSYMLSDNCPYCEVNHVEVELDL